MSEKFDRLATIVSKVFGGEATDEERAELQEWLNADAKNKELLTGLDDIEFLLTELPIYNQPIPIEAIWKRIDNEPLNNPLCEN
jgi:hypothetical protein